MNSAIRTIALMVLSLVPARGEQAGHPRWDNIVTSEGPAAILANCDDCDWVDLRLLCLRSAGAIQVNFYLPFENIAASRAAYGATVKITVEGRAYERSMTTSWGQMEHALYESVTVNPGDPVIQGIAGARTIAFEYGKLRQALNVPDPTQAVRALLQECLHPGKQGPSAE